MLDNDRVPLQEELSALEIFSGVSRDAMERIDASMVAHYEDADFLVHEGDAPDHLFVILSGRVCIRGGPARVFLVERGPGAVIGEQAFIERKPRSADVTCLGPVRALTIPANLVENLLDDHVFARNLLRSLSEKLGEATAQRVRSFAERKLIADQFRAHLNPKILDELLEDGLEYGKPRLVDGAIVLFADVRDFTRLSGSLDAQQLATQLAPYLTTMVDVVHATRGFVDKFVGDAVMAVWDQYPAFTPTSAGEVLDAAIDMIRSVRNIEFGGEPMRIGIGLNYGRVFMGNVGTEDKRQFTILGKVVNLASRYEHQTRELGVDIVCGDDFFEQLDEAHRALLTGREGVEIRGAGAQTIYALSVPKSGS